MSDDSRALAEVADMTMAEWKAGDRPGQFQRRYNHPHGRFAARISHVRESDWRVDVHRADDEDQIDWSEPDLTLNWGEVETPRQFSPLRFRPVDPHMGLWYWAEEPDEHGLWLLMEPEGRNEIGRVQADADGHWTISLGVQPAAWLRSLGVRAEAEVEAEVANQYDSPEEAAHAAEVLVGEIAIDSGMAPDPDDVPVCFVDGKQQLASKRLLLELERIAREHPMDGHHLGDICAFEGDPDETVCNPVAQARALHQMFTMPKGHWPPSVCQFDEALEHDLRYADQKIDLAYRLARPERAE